MSDKLIFELMFVRQFVTSKIFALVYTSHSEFLVEFLGIETVLKTRLASVLRPESV